MNETGCLVISLDFELYWGMRDKQDLELYRENLMGVKKAINEMLHLFLESDIHATWATVGFLFYENKEQLLKAFPPQTPDYNNKKLSPYGYIESQKVLDEQFHFASGLIKKIHESRGQEVATHTYSHYYCLESGQRLEEFREDLLSAVAVARTFGIDTESLVFPRNQWNQEYLGILSDVGIKTYRGNQDHWIYKAVEEENNNNFVRAMRLADTYINISGHNTYSWPNALDELTNVPASRFLRPYSKRFRHFEGLRLKRIKNSMTHAAKRNEVFHLWWHPHNFGANTEQNISTLNEILTHYRYLRDEYGMQSLSMAEFAGDL
ncbi:MAG: peptidoglycan/xylan/chitin deacetylase (PgdA/CDA1 family) [Neolewinella sp.]|jgi:peptidoglycan/xylan/chitin deacetylase (PgdA/CDA1 family)